MSWHYEEIKSSVDWFSPIKLCKPAIAIDPTGPNHCACAQNMLVRPIQVEVTLYLGQTDPWSWDIQTAYSHCTQTIPEAEISKRLIHIVPRQFDQLHNSHVAYCLILVPSAIRYSRQLLIIDHLASCTISDVGGIK